MFSIDSSGYCLGYGLSSDGKTTFINASTCSVMYRPVHKPVVFDIKVKDKTSSDDCE